MSNGLLDIQIIMLKNSQYYVSCRIVCRMRKQLTDKPDIDSPNDEEYHSLCSYCVSDCTVSHTNMSGSLPGVAVNCVIYATTTDLNDSRLTHSSCFIYFKESLFVLSIFHTVATISIINLFVVEYCCIIAYSVYLYNYLHNCRSINYYEIHTIL